VFAHLLAPIEAKYREIVASLAWSALAGIALLIAAVFGFAALLIWIASLYGGIVACLVAAGCFAVIAIVAFAMLITARKRARLEAEQRARARAAQAWLDPATISLGLQAVRMLSRHRGLALALLGSAALGWLLTREAEMPADEPAE
jgi:hypothetical protein